MENIQARLSEPFPAEAIGWKPQSVKGNRCLAVAYIDARDVQDRLDQVCGIDGWQDSYRCLPDGSVVCRLRLRLGDEWVTKMDVGCPSDQPDGGDRMKAAFSDALKRAAVKFGIGRYIYHLPLTWVDFDPQKKQIINPPRLPDWALPPKKAPSKPAAPANGAELLQRLQDYELKLQKAGRCKSGELLSHVTTAVVRKFGCGEKVTDWSQPAIALAVETARVFETGLAK